MSGLYELIERHATGDPDETTVAIFDALGLPGKWRDVFYAAVRDECRRRYRATVRDMEHGQNCDGPHAASAEPMSRTAYLAERFYNGTKWVEWATATVDDHLARIAFLKTMRNGIDATMAKHEQAIADITAAGVQCLAELEVVAA